MKKLLFIFPALFVLAFYSGVYQTARAQSDVRSLECAGLYTAIVKLNATRLKTPFVWRALEGDEYGYEQFRGATRGPAGTIIAGGVFSPPDNDYLNPYLLALSSKGDVKWTDKTVQEQDKTIEAVARLGDQYVTLGDVINPDTRFRGIHIRIYDMQGNFLKEKNIFDKTYDFYAMDMAVNKDQDIASLLVWVKNPSDKQDQYASLLQISAQGDVIRRRNYRPGPENKLLSLTPKADGTFIATGWIMQDDARKAGWVVRLGPSGYLMWQRAFARGKNAVFNAGQAHPDGGIIVGGYSEPVQRPPDDKNAAWALWLDPSGEPKWERFWRADYNLKAQDIITIEGERIQIMVQANTKDADKRDHVRVLSLTLRGQLLEQELFMEGGNTYGRKFLQHPSGKRVLIGHAQTVFSLDEAGLGNYPGIYDSWGLMLNAPGPYTDPCKPGARSGTFR